MDVPRFRRRSSTFYDKKNWKMKIEFDYELANWSMAGRKWRLLAYRKS